MTLPHFQGGKKKGKKRINTRTKTLIMTHAETSTAVGFTHIRWKGRYECVLHSREEKRRRKKEKKGKKVRALFANTSAYTSAGNTMDVTLILCAIYVPTTSSTDAITLIFTSQRID